MYIAKIFCPLFNVCNSLFLYNFLVSFASAFLKVFVKKKNGWIRKLKSSFPLYFKNNLIADLAPTTTIQTPTFILWRLASISSKSPGQEICNLSNINRTCYSNKHKYSIIVSAENFLILTPNSLGNVVTLKELC